MIDQLSRAEGFLELGMLSDAWEVIEDLPVKEKTSEPVLVIRLRILTGLSQWDWNSPTLVDTKNLASLCLV